MLNITLGTAGHIDHGKTALVQSLTGCNTDRLKEEQQRGMSIDLGYAPCTIADMEVGIVDVPGHESFVKTMVAGASGMDGVILVVAADDGIMPQTREHLEILTLLGLRHGMVALTKIDRVAPDQAAAVRACAGRAAGGHVSRRRAGGGRFQRHRRGFRRVLRETLDAGPQHPAETGGRRVSHPVGPGVFRRRVSERSSPVFRCRAKPRPATRSCCSLNNARARSDGSRSTAATATRPAPASAWR